MPIWNTTANTPQAYTNANGVVWSITAGSYVLVNKGTPNQSDPQHVEEAAVVTNLWPPTNPTMFACQLVRQGNTAPTTTTGAANLNTFDMLGNPGPQPNFDMYQPPLINVLSEQGGGGVSEPRVHLLGKRG